MRSAMLKQQDVLWVVNSCTSVWQHAYGLHNTKNCLQCHSIDSWHHQQCMLSWTFFTKGGWHTRLIQADSQREVALLHIARTGTGARQEAWRRNIQGGHRKQLDSTLAVSPCITDSYQQHDIVCSRLKTGTPLAVQLWCCTCSIGPG